MNESVDVLESKSPHFSVEQALLEQAGGDWQSCEPSILGHEHLRRFSARLLDIQEQERGRIAAELHDGLGQSLSIIKLGIEDAMRRLSTSSASEVGEVLQSLRDKVRRAIDEVREVSIDLRPSMLDDFGIVATVTWFLRELQWSYPDITIRQDIRITEAEVPVELRTTIYRIVQEAMNNIAHHHRAATVCLHFSCNDGAVVMAIEEVGREFDVTQVVAHTGGNDGVDGIGMFDRALLSGGECRIDSRAGESTVIMFRWPLR